MAPVVTKRDGREVPFDAGRIWKAALKAAHAIDFDDAESLKSIVDEAIATLEARETVDIDDIQQCVEDALMHSGHTRLARAYIEYRHSRDLARERRSTLIDEVEGLINLRDKSLLNENANKDSKVIPTQRDLLAGIIARHYAKRHILPRDVVRAHERGELHYHDLDYSPFFPMFNCMLVDLKGMLDHGFRMGNAEIETPKSIATAAAVTAQIIAQVASHIYGGTTLNRLDEVLAPYVRRSYMKHHAVAERWNIADADAYAMERTQKECKDAFQALEYEINTLHTANGQTPFVTFGFGLGTDWAARMIQKAILNTRLAGLGRHKKTAVFPKLVFSLKDGVNLNAEDPNYDIKQLAVECTSKRIYPDILNYDKVVEVTGSFKAPMGCRSFLSRWTNEQGAEVHDGRNNLGVVSLNLPRIAIEARGDEAEFWKLLDARLELAHKALQTRIDRLKHTHARVAPILYMEGACGVRMKADDCIADLFKNGRASISLGYIGLHETVRALFGSDVHLYDDVHLQEKAVAIVRHLKEATQRWTAESGYGYSLYSTPSENLCDRFCRLDRETFGVIDGVTDKKYYTNSFHLDVEKDVDPYSKIKFEQVYPPLASGGFICYGEYPNLQHNPKAIEDVWDFSYRHVPYYGTNTPVDECYRCGYQGEFDCTNKGFQCPSCSNHDPRTVSVIRRVCGYLGSPDARPFNEGKQEEVQRRVKHMGGSVEVQEKRQL